MLSVMKMEEFSLLETRREVGKYSGMKREDEPTMLSKPERGVANVRIGHRRANAQEDKPVPRTNPKRIGI